MLRRLRNRPRLTSPDDGPVRLRLDIAYDGTDFHGWAAQRGVRTVAGVLDEALSTVFRSPVRLFAAGRTDAGVHATGQVAHADIDSGVLGNAYARGVDRAEGEFAALVRRLARFLPNDVRVREISRAPSGFDARFSALRRHYVYRLALAPHGAEPQTPASSRPGPARWTSTRWRPRRETCWGCTTSRHFAGGDLVPPRSGNYSGWTGSVTQTW